MNVTKIEFKWDPKDRYFSNEGAGPLVGKILDVTASTVNFEYWNNESKAESPIHKKCILPVSYFVSAKCAWRKMPHSLKRLERDDYAKHVVLRAVAGQVSHKAAARELGLPIGHWRYLFRQLSKKSIEIADV